MFATVCASIHGKLRVSADAVKRKDGTVQHLEWFKIGFT
jgi:hypothetical protein